MDQDRAVPDLDELLEGVDQLVADAEERLRAAASMRLVQELAALALGDRQERFAEVVSWADVTMAREALVMLAGTFANVVAAQAESEPGPELEAAWRSQWALPELEREMLS